MYRRGALSTKDENQQLQDAAVNVFKSRKALAVKEVNNTKTREALQNIQNRKKSLSCDRKDNYKTEKSNGLVPALSSHTIFFDDSVDVFKRVDDPLQYREYIEDVYSYLRHKEKLTAISEAFLKIQDEITDKMRWILVDWIIQVHARFDLNQETLFISVQITDRFVDKYPGIRRNQLQLVGITSLLLASKYEEQCVPEMKDYVHVTDYSCTGAQIRDMEVCILNTLDFDISPPVALHFLRRITKACQINQRTHNLAKYFMELCLLDSFSCRFFPSYSAAACVCLAMRVTKECIWDGRVESIAGYKRDDLCGLMMRVPYIVSRNEELRLSAVYNKYLKSHGCVSSLEFLKSEQFKNFYPF